MKKKLPCFLIILSVLMIACGNQKEYLYTKFLVGGQCEIRFYLNNEKAAKKIISEMEQELARIDSLLNRFSDKSLVSELNRTFMVQAPKDIIYLFVLCDSISRLTDGLFDISIAPLVKIWGFYKHEYLNPDTAEIEIMKQLVNYEKIQIKADSVMISKNMEVDLGGIAQGYAADRVAGILERHHVRSALINIAGEIVAIGQSPKGRPWRIGIKNPRGDGALEIVELEDGALSTSGDYEKFFILDGKKYPHIINPLTGFPALDFASVTVFAESASFADAIATAIAIMGPQRGMKFLDSLRIQGIIYYEEDEILQRLENK